MENITPICTVILLLLNSSKRYSHKHDNKFVDISIISNGGARDLTEEKSYCLLLPYGDECSHGDFRPKDADSAESHERSKSNNLMCPSVINDDVIQTDNFTSLCHVTRTRKALVITAE